MISRQNTRKLLSIDQFKPTDPRFRVVGVFNPGVARYQNEIVMLVRVAESVIQDDPTHLDSARVVTDDSSVRYHIDHFKVTNWTDKRKPIIEGGLCRLAFISHLELVHLSPDATKVLSIERPDELFPRTSYEEFGIEDPRITQIGDTYYITYVAVSRELSVATCLMSTTDFKKFRRHGVIFDADTKDVVIFPEMIQGKFACLVRPMGNINIRKPAILGAYSPDLVHWGKYGYVLGCSETGWDSERVGAGAPPLYTKHGWLHIYHGVGKNQKNGTRTYSPAAFLTAPQAPWQVIARSVEPLFDPSEPYEKDGYINEVIFPTAFLPQIEDAKKALLFYGATDSVVAVTEVDIDEIIRTLK